MTDQAQSQAATPTKEELAAAKAAAEAARQEEHLKIKAQFNNLVDVIDTDFTFKKVPIVVDGKETGDFNKRATITLALPVPSVEGIVYVLEHGQEVPKQLELLKEAVAAYVEQQARQLLNDDETLTASNFPLDKLSWEFISNMEKKDRRGGGIAKETWEEFIKDYVAIMPGLTGKAVDVVTMGAKYIAARYAPVRFRKDVIAKLDGYVKLWFSNTKNAEQFQEVYEFLTKKATELLAMTEDNLASNL